MDEREQIDVGSLDVGDKFCTTDAPVAVIFEYISAEDGAKNAKSLETGKVYALSHWAECWLIVEDENEDD